MVQNEKALVTHTIMTGTEAFYLATLLVADLLL
jgi:hypothetical protein